MADRRVELLSRVPLFAGSNRRQLRGVLEWTKEYAYRTGATIVREGAGGQDLFVVLEGKARVERNGKTVARLGAGDFFGELSVIDGRPRTATVVAEEPVDCLVLRRGDFRQLVEGDGALAWNLLGAMASRFRPD